LKQKGFVDKIGVSVYKPEEADFLLNNGFNFDLIQVPFNILDQRFSGCFASLKERNIEINSRSTFLQGLFFLDLDTIEKKFPMAQETIKKLCAISQEHKIPVYALCLCFAVLNPSIDKVVIGVDSIAQLEQNLDSLGYLDKVKAVYGLLERLEFNNEEVVIPSNWK
ncbi:MAG: aldo/keto reductase, partial [Candidatus Omnitrophica bacterium]|nr:aldo/keto reductase [Candidatus Omnitrophota bacterium]